MKTLLVILVTFLISSLNANDYWNKDDGKPYFQQRDNLAHIGVSGIVSYIASDYALSNGFTKTESWFIGVIL